MSNFEDFMIEEVVGKNEELYKLRDELRQLRERLRQREAELDELREQKLIDRPERSTS